MSLLRVSRQCTEDASRAQSRKRRRHRIDQDLQRARWLWFMGELSAGRQALEGAELALGTPQTLQSLRDPRRLPPPLVEALLVKIIEHEPAKRCQLDEHKFATNLQKSRRGAAAGPSSMTTDHLRPVLDNPRDTHLFFQMGEQLAQGHPPQKCRDDVYVLTTPDRVGDVYRALQEELFGRTLARRRCGTQQEFAPQRATCLRGSHKRQTRGQGGERFRSSHIRARCSHIGHAFGP